MLIRQVIFKHLHARKHFGKLRVGGILLIIIGIFWLLFILTLKSWRIFTSENSADTRLLSGDPFRPNISDSAMSSLSNQFSERKTSPLSLILELTSNMNLKSYIHTFPVYTGSYKKNGKNIYTYIRSKRGMGTDCILIAYKYNIERYNISWHSLSAEDGESNKTDHYAEIISIIELMKTLSNTDWLSRDLLFLGYDGTLNYAKGVREFLKDYHSNSNTQQKQHVERAGIIRQAIALDVQDELSNMWAIQIGRINI
jgi:hypothetical protein